MNKCPKCQEKTRQNRAGKTDAGSQRYRCMHCTRKYTPEPKQQGYPDSMRKRAVEMYVDGGNLRRIAHHLRVAPRTVALWVTEVAKALPDAPMPEEVKEAEMDELFTFIGDKNRIYILTVADCETRCILGWAVVWTRTQEAMQHVVDQAPKAKWYYSDGFDAYRWLWYHFGRYEVSEGKTNTYSVEADNAELHHYLARLARKSRCFSRCPYRSNALYVYSFTASTVGSFINNGFRSAPLRSWTSLAHPFSHSPPLKG